MILDIFGFLGKKIKTFIKRLASLFTKPLALTQTIQIPKEGTGVDLIQYIMDADNTTPALHDIKIKFESDLHKYLASKNLPVNQKNQSIKITIPTNNPNVTVKALVYPKTIQLDVGCTDEAYSDDDAGKKQLALLLSSTWQYLCEYSGHRAEIPEPFNWIITHYHYGKDGKMEYDGKKFHITAYNALGEFIRAYSKTLLDGSTIVRIEKVRTEKITIGALLGDRGK